MAKKKKGKKKDEGSSLSAAAVSVAETLAGLINSPLGRQIVADALVAAAGALVADRAEAGKKGAQAAAGVAEAAKGAGSRAKTTAEVAVGIVGDAATRLVSTLVSGESGGTANGAAEPTGDASGKKTKRARGTKLADRSSPDDPSPAH